MNILSRKIWIHFFFFWKWQKDNYVNIDFCIWKRILIITYKQIFNLIGSFQGKVLLKKYRISKSK